MAITLVTLLDTFLSWMNKTNETIVIANLATEGQLNSSGTLKLTNSSLVGGSISLNVANGMIKGDGGLLSNVSVPNLSITNIKMANDNIQLVSNLSATLTVVTSGPGANANLGSTMYISLKTTSLANDTSTSNVATANLTNVIYSLAIAAYNAANIGATSGPAFDKANSANVVAASAFDKANAANLLAFVSSANAASAFDKANAANLLAFVSSANAAAAFDKANTAGGGYYKGNRGTIGGANNVNDLFRINYLYQTANITIDATERAVAVGPLTINTGFTLTITSGGRAVII